MKSLSKFVLFLKVTLKVSEIACKKLPDIVIIPSEESKHKYICTKAIFQTLFKSLVYQRNTLPNFTQRKRDPLKSTLARKGKKFRVVRADIWSSLMSKVDKIKPLNLLKGFVDK